MSCALLWWTVDRTLGHYFRKFKSDAATNIYWNVTPVLYEEFVINYKQFWYLLQVILDVNECLNNYEIKYKDVGYQLDFILEVLKGFKLFH